MIHAMEFIAEESSFMLGLFKKFHVWKQERKMKKWYLDKNAKSSKDHLSPSGRYKLIVTKHETGKGTWAVSKGKIVRTCDGKIVDVVKRNYSAFPFAWVEDHPNGHDYLICGEDYQGQTFVELDTTSRISFMSPGAHAGFGFCWAEIHPSPNKMTLAVVGCVWGGPFEVRFWDFRDPYKHPIEIKSRVSDNEWFSNFGGWNANGSADLIQTRGRRLSDGKWFSELTEKEQEKAWDEDDCTEEDVITTVTFKSGLQRAKEKAME
jgi:hypothetical protein